MSQDLPGIETQIDRMSDEISALIPEVRELIEVLDLVKLQRSKKVRRALKLVREGTLLPPGFAQEWRWHEPIAIMDEGRHEDIFQHRVYAAENIAWKRMTIFNPESPLMANTFEPMEEFQRLLRQDWFRVRAGALNPHVRLEPDMGMIGDSKLVGAAIPEFNVICVIDSLPHAETFDVLIHEVTHFLVGSPYAAHGRLFNHTQTWIWSHLDERFGTDHAAWLLGYYEKNNLPYMPREFDQPRCPPKTLMEALKAHPLLQTEDLRHKKGGCFWIYDIERTDSADIIHFCCVLQEHGINATIGHRKKGRRAGQCGIFLPSHFKDKCLTEALAAAIRAY